MCAEHSARAIDLLAAQGTGARTASGLVKSQQHVPALPAKVAEGLVAICEDNVDNYGRKPSRADDIHVEKRIAVFTAHAPASSPHSQAQYQPLREHPLRPLTMADFRVSDTERRALDTFLHERMLEALASALLHAVDLEQRKRLAEPKLHEHGLKATVCISPDCDDRLVKYHTKLTRICPVSTRLRWFRFLLPQRCLPSLCVSCV